MKYYYDKKTDSLGTVKPNWKEHTDVVDYVKQTKKKIKEIVTRTDGRAVIEIEGTLSASEQTELKNILRDV